MLENNEFLYKKPGLQSVYRLKNADYLTTN